ncbi:MAG: hypothetical protein AB7P21_07150 [Lautropia sp.]
MRTECIEAVSKAVGRKINRQEADGIEQRILRIMESRARKDPEWMAKTRSEQLGEAADIASRQLVEEAKARAIRTAQNVQQQARLIGVVEKAKADGTKQAGALFDEIVRVENYAKGVLRDFTRRLTDLIDAVHPKAFYRLADDARMVEAFVREMHGVDTGSVIAKKAAQAVTTVNEHLRVRANAAGANIGKLDYSYLPLSHNEQAARKAGEAKWIETAAKWLDRDRYRQADGRRMSDEQIKAMLREMYATITTGGTNKIEPGQFTGTGGLTANPYSKHRELHLKGPEGYLAYMANFGDASIIGAQMRYLRRMSRDIALAEQMGPNWRGNFKAARDTILKNGASTHEAGWVFDVETSFETMVGTYSQPKHATFAQVSQDIRNLEVSAKLGGAILSSINDVGTLVLNSMYHRLPVHQIPLNFIRAMGKDAKAFAEQAGMMADSIVSDMGRFSAEHLGSNWSAKAATMTMRLSFLEAWTDATRRAASIPIMAAYSKLAKQDWGALHELDRLRLERAGFTPEDWKVLRAATPEKWHGQDMVTPESIYRISDPAITQAMKERAAARFLGYLADEGEYSVLAPDLRTRTIVQMGTNKGTLAGELARHTMLFKSFPISMITRTWRRVLTDPTVDTMTRSKMFAMLSVGLLPFGYLSLGSKDIAKGKDPQPVDDPKTWAAAYIQAGGLGIMGDFLLNDVNRFGNSLIETAAGPVAGDVAGLFKATVGNVHRAARGETTHTGADLLKVAKGLIPVAGSLWYTRAAMERLMLNELQETMSPGYITRMKAQAAKDRTGFWWEPGQAEPARAPNLTRMLPEAPS